ncbi:Stp1/IreP family PP2C-type Ser/Thr phosphatase [Rhodoferax antarcticus]|uniref:Phosphatase 2C-like protein n=1 Tax=Rhodoferax antarcticus ANT.BR TaxID=1111071 RepID=A0A1Q8YHN9_9BURK|nr:phosphatase 2C-like protein [Rhodoferax antarcticus ANT.BR]
MMQFSFHGLTDTGLVRTNNEDAFDFDAIHGVAMLADGMGGYNAGEVASSMAVLGVKGELVRWLAANGPHQSAKQVSRVVETCFDEANLAILNASISNPHYTGMGTTLVVGVFHDRRLILAHVGDSRCYRLRSGVLTQMTKDHSMLQEQVDAGFLTQAQAAYAPGKNLLTRALGVEEVLRVDLREHAVEPGDLYLMCSDGLTDMMTDKEMTLVLTQRAQLVQMAAELVEQCNRNGGRDNISVMLVQADGPAGKTGLISRMFSKP